MYVKQLSSREYWQVVLHEDKHREVNRPAQIVRNSGAPCWVFTAFHCRHLTFHCLSLPFTAFCGLFTAFLCLSLTFHCQSLPFVGLSLPAVGQPITHTNSFLVEVMR